jgi:16S rRNA (guanine527-N7)-methyltransferase
MIDKDRLLKKRQEYNINLTDRQGEKFKTYAEILVSYNEKVNLTAIVDPQDIENKHFIDCLYLANSEYIKGQVLDVGSGAGFPALVLAIFKKDISVSAMEPTGKRCEFLKYAGEILNVDLTVIKERREEAARGNYREKYDTVTARAVAPLNILAEYCLPLVKVGGYFVAMKGNNPAEIENSENAVAKLGGKSVKIDNYTLPKGEKRTLVIIKKTKPTPPAYPRNGGKIKKSPL